MLGQRGGSSHGRTGRRGWIAWFFRAGAGCSRPTVAPRAPRRAHGGGPRHAGVRRPRRRGHRDLHFTGAAQTWTVPAGVTSATFDLYGAEGENNPPSNSPRHSAAARRRRSRSPPAPDPGQRRRSRSGLPLYGRLQRRRPGAVDRRRGGGASDIRIGGTALADRVLVAGGGGGSGACLGNNVPTEGGDGGGALGGDAFTPSLCTPAFGTVGGGGGTQTEGGSATSPATPGSFGVGGNAPGGGNAAGGGGGGWYGAGGGLNFGGGGGGSGHGPAGTTFETGFAAATASSPSPTRCRPRLAALRPRLAALRHCPTTASASAS